MPFYTSAGPPTPRHHRIVRRARVYANGSRCVRRKMHVETDGGRSQIDVYTSKKSLICFGAVLSIDFFLCLSV